MWDKPFNPNQDSTDIQWLEVIDRLNRPLLVLSSDEVHRQDLAHRGVHVLVYDRKGRLLLQKRSGQRQSYPHFWDISASAHVLAGQSREEAALSCQNRQLGIKREFLQLRFEIPASPQTVNELITLFSVDIDQAEVKPQSDLVEDVCFLDHDEMTTMITDFAELLTPTLLHLNSLGLLFQPSMTAVK